ncbi:hypothetical protein ACFYRL_35615 [Streptomyces goshikiensis]|uniref:hypothetical protein n=1 Tax=Streptomyces goshikiensis TaxID=1942 RepID=UPI00367D3BA6
MTRYDHFPFFGYVYVATHAGLGALKVGMSTGTRNAIRGSGYVQAGWKIYRWEPWGGQYDAEGAEQYALVKLRERFRSGFLANSQMPYDGETETFALAEVSTEVAWLAVEEGMRMVRLDYTNHPRRR